MRSTLEAVQGIAANCKGFREYILELEEAGYGYRVYRGDRPIMNKSEILDPVAAETLIIAPINCGAGGLVRGVGAILTGAALIGIGLATGFGAVALAGAAIGAKGFSEVISKSNVTPATDTERSQSFLFDFGSSGPSSRLAVVPYAVGQRFVQLTTQLAISQLVETHDLAIG